MKLNKLMQGIAALLIISLLLPFCVFAREEQSVVLYSESFNQYATNEMPAKYNLPKSGFARIAANEGGTDKSLLIKSESEDIQLNCKFNDAGVTDLQKVIASVKFKGIEGKPNVTLGFYDGALKKEVNFLNIDSRGNIMLASNNKIIGGIGEGITTAVTVGYDLTVDTYCVYLDNEMILRDYRMPEKLINPSQFDITVGSWGREGVLYIDDVRVYTGTALRTNITPAVFNPAEVPLNEVKDEVGNKIFLENDFEAQNKPMTGITGQDKGNVMKVDYDKSEKNHYLYMDKILKDDPFADVTVVPGTKYLVNEMNVKITKPGAQNYLIMARDNTTVAGSKFDEYVLLVNPQMQLVCANKTLMQLQTDEWYHIAAIFNMRKKTIDVYVDHKPLAEGLVFTKQDMKVINQVRITQASGAAMGDLCIDNYRVYEGTKPGSSDAYISIFSDGDEERAILKDKIAVHAYSGSGYKENKKFDLQTKPLIDSKDVVYVETADINGLLGTELKTDNGAVYNGTEKIDLEGKEKDGKIYLPIKKFAEDVLKKKTYDNGIGLVVISDTEMAVPKEKKHALNNFMFYQRPSGKQVEELFNQTSQNGSLHPRICATREDFLRIKNTREQDPLLNKWYTNIMATANTLVQNPQMPTYVLPDGLRLLETSRLVMRRLETLGFAYQMTGDKKYPERAWLELQAIFAFPDWNPAHMLDVGEMVAGVGIAYDWMYDAFDEIQKKTIVEKIKEMGLNYIRDAYYGRLFVAQSTGGRSDMFATWDSNFNTVINGGGVLGALAIAENDRAYCFDFVEKALRSLEYVMPMYDPDGGWQEGVTYWGYNGRYLQKLVGSLDSAVGSDFGLMKYRGVDKYALFPISQESWKGMNNFHDAVPYPIEPSALTWLAMKFDNPDVLRYRRFEGEHYNNNYEVYDPIYYDIEKAKGDIQLPLDNYTRVIESFSSRESYTDSAALFFAGQAGQTTAYHSHPDTGAFVFEIAGVRWSVDLGMDTYTPKFPGSYYYRKRTEGHSALVINPDQSVGQLDNTFSPVIRAESKPKGSIYVIDMSAPYGDNASKVLRGFKVGDERRSLTIRDEVDLQKDNSEVYWFMQTNADIQTTEKGAILKQDGKELRLEFVTNAASAEITGTAAISLPSSPHIDEDIDKNKAYKRVAIKLKGSGHVDIAVKLSSMDDSDTGIDNRPIGEWTIPDGELVKRESVRADMIYAGGKPLSGFSPDEMKYNIFINEGDAIPAISAEAGGRPIEVKQIDAGDHTSVVTVYNDENKLFKTRYMVKLNVIKAIPALKDYQRLIVDKLTVGSVPESANGGENMADGNIETRWTTFTLQDEALFDLGESKTIDAFAASFWKGNERAYKFEVLVSDDNIGYTSVFKGQSSGTTADVELVNIPQVKARYVKLISGGNTVNANLNVQEFAILQK